MFCLATKILTYLPFFYLIIFMTSNCQDALEVKATFMLKMTALHGTSTNPNSNHEIGRTTLLQMT